MRVSLRPDSSSGKSQKAEKSEKPAKPEQPKHKDDKKKQTAETATPDTKVSLSERAKEPSPEKEMREAELLMDHVNSGKLSGDERDMAMKRVGVILKKYGTA